MEDVGGVREKNGETRTATASVLFSDVVGSTEQRSRLGDDAADALWHELDARLAEVVGRHHGRVVKSLGDGVLAVFESAADAVVAAVSIQQEAAPRSRAALGSKIELRVGIASGDVAFNSGDVFGSPVVEASRLCGAAQPSQILVADVVRSLSRGRGSQVFEAVGNLTLKGLPEPVAACEVIWQPLVPPGSDAAGLPLPGLLSAGIAGYVGREDVMDRLAALWEARAGEGGSAAVLLSGEPGVGKTRTASEIARLAHATGGAVLYGRCDEDLGVPFQPFVEAVDFYTANHPSPRLGRLPGELARLCPEVAGRVLHLPAAVISDPQTEEYRLFEAVTSWMIEASKESGLVLVLDDLHWATRATLLLLQHVLTGASADESARLLVVGTYRDTELDRRHPLTAVLADLRRLPSVERIDLAGLSFEETLVLVERAAGHELDEPGRRLAEATYAETEGNPFFVGEVLRHFVETGQVRFVDGRWEVSNPGHVLVPEGVKDVIGRRLGRLSDIANRVLSVASVLGRDFDLELLGSVVDLDEMAVLDALDEASRARMIEETGSEQFRFFHAMVRDTLYEELSTPRRRRVHHHVAEVLEKLRPHDSGALAYHALEAGPTGGDMARAVAYLLEAARQSARIRDLSGAERFYLQAIEILDGEEPDPMVRLEVLCGLGEVQRDQSNPAYRETLLETARRSLQLGQTDLAARACIANFRGFSSVINAVDEERIEVLQATVRSIDEKHGPHWALLTATLAAEVIYDRSVPLNERLGLVDAAKLAARELDDPRVLAEVIIRSYQAALVPDRWLNAKSVAEEVLQLVDQIGDPTLQALGRLLGASGYLGVGEIHHAETLITQALRISERDCPPFVQVAARANFVQFLTYRGRMEEATLLNDEAQALGRQVGMVDIDQWWVANVASLEGVRGRMGDLADLAGTYADQYRPSATWRCAHARTLAEAGRLEEAREVLARFHLHRPEEIPIDPFVLTCCLHLGVIATVLHDSALGAAIERVLKPYREMWVHHVIYAVGPVSWAIALSLVAQERWDEAIEFFDDAGAQLESRGMTTNLLLMRRDLARALALSPSLAHRRRSREVASLGLDEARCAAGFERLGEQFAEILSSLDERT